jgi:negative regulator of flagellin synthesis FlgM
MKITGPPDPSPLKKGNSVSDPAKVAAKNAAASLSQANVNGTTTQGATAASEKILVSDVGREVAKIQGQLKKTPDIRTDKVKAIKSQIDSGSYYVSSDKIASKIVEDIVRNG